MRSQERKHRGPENPPQLQRGHWDGALSPHSKPAAHRLSFQGASSTAASGSPAAESTVSAYIAPIVYTAVSLQAGGWSAWGGVQEGWRVHSLQRGNFRCIVSLAPATPQPVLPEPGGAPGFGPSEDVGFGRRPGQQDERPRPGPGRALPQWGQDTGRELGTSALLCASTETAWSMSLTLRSPTNSEGSPPKGKRQVKAVHLLAGGS